LRIDGVGTDEELLRFGVDEAIRGRAADALGVDDLAERGVDGVEFIVGALGLMRRVGDDPEFAGPRDDGAGAALAAAVEHREVRVNAAEGSRRLGGKRRGAKSEREGSEEGSHQ
jgi:hypothetical protein